MEYKKAEMVPPEQTRKPMREMCQESIILTEFFKKASPGSAFTWSELELATGVPMSLAHRNGARNRALTKGAILRAGHTQGWVSGHGIGFTIAGVKESMPVSEHRRKRIRGQVRRARRETHSALDRFGKELPGDVKARLELRAVMLDTISSMSTHRQLESDAKLRLANNNKPVMPEA